MVWGYQTPAVIADSQGKLEMGDGTFEQLDETDIHWTFNEASNSIAVIVKHMRGNMLSRWTNFLTTDGCD